MAKVYITEHQLEILNGVQVVKMPPIRSQTVVIGAGALSSNPFSPSAQMIRINTDSICSIEFGGVNATTSSARMAANQTEYFAITGGDSVSVIANT